MTAISWKGVNWILSFSQFQVLCSHPDQPDQPVAKISCLVQFVSQYSSFGYHGLRVCPKIFIFIHGISHKRFEERDELHLSAAQHVQNAVINDDRNATEQQWTEHNEKTPRLPYTGEMHYSCNYAQQNL